MPSEPLPSEAWLSEITWSAIVTGIGAVVAYAVGEDGADGRTTIDAVLVLATLAAAQAMVVLVIIVRGATRLQREQKVPRRDPFE